MEFAEIIQLQILLAYKAGTISESEYNEINNKIFKSNELIIGTFEKVKKILNL